MMILLTKITSPEMVGQYALGFAICGPVLLFTNLELRSVLAVDTSQKYHYAHYFTLRLITTFISIIIIIFIIFLGKYSYETKQIILAAALLHSLISFNDIYYGLFQKNERFDRIGISKINKGLLMIMGFGLGVYFTHSAYWGLILTSLLYILNLIFYDIPQGSLIIKNSEEYKQNSPKNFLEKYGLRLIWSKGPLKQLAWYALPLGLAMVMISLNINIPRYLIAHFLGEKELGIYSAIAYPILIGGAAIYAMGASAAPRMAKYYAQFNNKAFLHIQMRLTAIALFLGIAAVLIAFTKGEYFLTLIYKPEYAQRNDVFILLMTWAGIQYLTSTLNFAVTAAHYFRSQTPVMLVAILTNLACSAFLIPRYGLRGAAIGSIIGGMTHLIGFSIVLLYALRKNKQPINQAT